MKRGVGSALLVALMLISRGTSFAEEAKPIDGGVWKQLNADNKALFTLGYATGIAVFAKFAPGPCGGCAADCMDDASAKLVPIGTGIPQVVQVVDKIYEDPANQIIPVQWALKLAAQKLKGVSDEDWKAALSEAREGSGPAKTTP